MDRRIALRYPVTGRGPDGAALIQWVELGSIWAQWLGGGSRELVAAQARHAETTGILRIRHRGDIGATWRVVKGDDLFELTGDPMEIGRREYLDLPVRALDQSPESALSVRLLHDGTTVLLHDGSVEPLHPPALAAIGSRLLHDGSNVLLHDNSNAELHAA